MKYVPLFLGWEELLNAIPPDKAMQLINAYFAYVKGEEPQLDNDVRLLFISHKHQLDEVMENWERKRRAQTENGKKGGRPRKSESE